MALLGDDGRGYDLARKLETLGVWRSWLGESLYPNFIPFLSSASSWETFMRTNDSKSRAQMQLQLRARALLFDKASVSLFLQPNHSSSSASAISKLNPTYLQLHGDDIYFTLETSQDGIQQRDGVVVAAAAANSALSKIPSKASFAVGSRYGESDGDNLSHRFRLEELPETWYNQFIESYRSTKPYRSSFGNRETDRRTAEQMATYLKAVDQHKRRRVAFTENQSTRVSHPMLENGANLRPHLVLDDNNISADEISFFPEMMFPLNCVPDSALPPANRLEKVQKVEFNGILDNLPKIMTRSPIMIERLGIRPEYLSMERGGNLGRGRNGPEGNRKCLSQEQASQMSQKVIARLLASLGFEGASEVPMEVLSHLLSCHISKLGCTLKFLADSYRRQCSAVELIKMFLHTAGYSNLGVLAELVKDNTRNSVQQNQQIQGIQSQLQSQLQMQLQHQTAIRQPQQMPSQMHPQLQQAVHPQNMAPQNHAFQQQQQWEKMQRRQPSTPRPSSMNMMNMDKERPLVQVKIENTDFPMDNNVFATLNARHSQLQQLRHQHQQQQLAAMSNFSAQSSNQFRPMHSLQIPQIQSPNMGMARAPPVKVEGFQELMGGDSTLKHDSEENKLTSPSK